MIDQLLSVISRGTDNGDWSTTINPGEAVTIPKGYHNGEGKVTANGVGTPTVLVNTNTRAQSWSGNVSGYSYYLFIYATGHPGNHSPSVSNGSVVSNISLTTTDFDDGLYRDLGHLAIIKANDTGTVTISCTVGSNYYGGSRVVVIGI